MCKLSGMFNYEYIADSAMSSIDLRIEWISRVKLGLLPDEDYRRKILINARKETGFGFNYLIPDSRRMRIEYMNSLMYFTWTEIQCTSMT